MGDYDYPEDRNTVSPSESKEYRQTAANLNSQQPAFNDKPNKGRRDILDNIFTYVNRDLFVCKLFYFFFFGAFGSLFPLMAIYFKQLGMNASQGGVLIGFRPFIEFLSAPFWGGLADRWKRAKELLLFSLFCWIVFTLSIAFVHPPAHKCLYNNKTHTVLENPRNRRDASCMHGDFDSEPLDLKLPCPIEHEKPWILLPQPMKRGTGQSPHRLDHNKIVNANKSDVEGLVHSPYSTVVYKEGEVKEVFFILLLIVVIGEFFSAPAITFADAMTLACLGDDTDNYGRQRMFGSLGWGISMFFAGLALDHSTTFPEHPCGTQHAAEKNYTVCFAIFCVFMSAAFVAALQFRFDYIGHRKEIQLSVITEKVKDIVRRAVTGQSRIDRQRLVESDDEDAVFKPELGSTAYNKQNNAYPESTTQETNHSQDLNIKLNHNNDMVSDVTRATNQYSQDDSHFLGKWVTVFRLLANYKYLSVLFIAWFMGFGIGIIFTFLFWHLQDLGGSPTLFGVASVINHISELLAYFMSAKFIARWALLISLQWTSLHRKDDLTKPFSTLRGLYLDWIVIGMATRVFAHFVFCGHIRVLYAGLIGNVCRFLYISWLHNPWWVLPFEFVQGLTHAAVWASCCSYITQAIPKELRSSAQGILQGLHHGLGRGCGAVFGGVLVYSYGSVVTFRAYGITCIFILALYMGVNYYLERKGLFSHSTAKSHHEIMEDTGILAPHGVPSGASSLARDISSSRLADKDPYSQQGYGATTYEGQNTLTTTNMSNRGFNDSYSDQKSTGWPSSNDDHTYREGDRVFMETPPRMSTQMYQQQPHNTMDQMYGP